MVAAGIPPQGLGLPEALRRVWQRLQSRIIEPESVFERLLHKFGEEKCSLERLEDVFEKFQDVLEKPLRILEALQCILGKPQCAIMGKNACWNDSKA